jgi:dehydrogenase/reductase SDR family member 7B
VSSYFKNKVVWITGASSGIGEALAYLLAAQKAKLVLSARRVEELERVKTNTKIAPDDVLILPFDLSDSSQASRYVEEIIKKFGGLDVLINNGGISQRAEAKDTEIAIDRKIMEVNFFSYVALTKAVLPQMISQKSGHVVAISSIAGKFGFYYRSAYAASKHALHGFFESLRLETEKYHIKTTLVCPGKIKTAISINALTQKGEKFNHMDESQEKGMSAKLCASKILRAIEKSKKEVLIGNKELIPVYLKRFVPGVFEFLIRRVKKE